MTVLFFYIHINHQYKKSQDLEIYELEYKNIEHLQEICDVRQPVVFNLEPMIRKYPPIDLEIISSIEKEYGNTLNVKNTDDYFNNTCYETMKPTEVPLSFHNTIQLIKTANSTIPHFFTENNNEFIEETGIDTIMIKIGNAFLKPNYTVNQSFDIMTAEKGVGLPLKYHTFTRKYIYVSSGRIIVKMAPFKNIKKLDFNNLLLVSPMNCWKPQQCFISRINKIRFLEFDISKGYILYIPPYWIYSILYDNDDTCLLEYNYQTAINIIAHPRNIIHSFKTTINSILDSLKSNEKKEDNYLNDKVETNTETEIESVKEVENKSKDYDLSIITNSTSPTTTA